jgi:hypothetical protein
MHTHLPQGRRQGNAKGKDTHTGVFCAPASIITMVTTGGDLQPVCLADWLLTGLGQPQINPCFEKKREKSSVLLRKEIMSNLLRKETMNDLLRM